MDGTDGEPDTIPGEQPQGFLCFSSKQLADRGSPCRGLDAGVALAECPNTVVSRNFTPDGNGAP